MNLQTSPALNRKLATHQLRRSFLADLFSRSYVAVTEELGRHHEAFLRHTAGRRTRLQNRLGTPV